MVWDINPCWPEQARWLLKLLRVDLNSKKLHRGGGFDCTALALCWMLGCLIFKQPWLALGGGYHRDERRPRGLPLGLSHLCWLTGLCADVCQKLAVV